MAKVSVIYRAAKGDAKIVEWGEHTFFDGHAVEVEDTPDNTHMLAKMATHPLFELSEMGEVNRQAPPPFAEMRTGNPAYPRVEVEEAHEGPNPTAFEGDYEPIEEAVKRKRGRPRKYENVEEDEPEDAA